MKKKNKIPIYVIILTLNEEKHILRCIKNLKKNVEKIIVVDSFSSDRTSKICKKEKLKFYQNKFKTHSNQLNWILKKIKKKNIWVLRIDADEIIERNFFKKLNLIKNLNNYNAIEFIIEHKFLGHKINYGGVYPQKQIRMWKNKSGIFDNKPMDEKIKIFYPKILKSKIKIIDYNLKGLKFWFFKHNFYAKQESKLFFMYKNKVGKILHKGNSFSNKMYYYKYPIFIRPFLLFFYRYIMKRGFLDGLVGLKFCLMQTLYYRMLVDIYIAKSFLFKLK